MMTHTQEEIKEALQQHQLYLIHLLWKVADPKTRGAEPPKGIRFALKDLRDADLTGADLRLADLRWANLRGADLKGVKLQVANLYRANLRWADLREADLRGADLMRMDLSGADLRGASLSGANLDGANLTGANLEGIGIRVAVGNGKEVKSIDSEKYRIVWTATDLAIGCQQHSLAKWLAFTTKEKAEFADDALVFLDKWLPILDSMGVFDSVKGKERKRKDE